MVRSGKKEKSSRSESTSTRTKASDKKKTKIQRRIEGEEKTIIQLVLNFNRVVVVAAALASASCGLHPIKIHTRPEDKKMNLVKRKKEKTVQRI